MRKRKVLFVYCYAAATQGKLKNVGGSHPPIGILYPAAVLEKEGYEVRVSDELVNDNTERIIQEFRPEVLCLSVNTPCVPRAKSLVEFGKQHGVSLFVAGGAHATNEPESCINDVGVDVSVISEGEAVLPDLLRNDNWSDITGFVYKNKEGKIINNGKRPLIQDLDSIPFPARHLLDFSKYAGTAILGFFLHKNEKWTPVITSRGCPFLCTFCANWRVMGRDTRDRSPENVIEELKEIKYKYGINAVDFVDDTFVLRPERIKKFCELMIKENLNMKWSCQSRVTITKEMLQLMKNAGCELIAFGVESGKFSPVPGSEYYEENKESLKHMKWDDYSYFYGKNSEEVEKRHKRIVREFYLRPTYLINFLKRFSWLELNYMIRMFSSFTKM